MSVTNDLIFHSGDTPLKLNRPTIEKILKLHSEKRYYSIIARELNLPVKWVMHTIKKKKESDMNEQSI